MFMGKIFHFLSSQLNNQRLKHSILLTSGTLFNNFLGLFFYIILARSLTVASFGQFAFIVSLGILLSDLLEMGMGSSVIRFVHHKEHPQIVGLAYTQRLVLTLILTLGGIGAFYVEQNALGMAFLITISLLLQFLSNQISLAMQNVGGYIFANFLGNAIRLLIVALTIYFVISFDWLFVGILYIIGAITVFFTNSLINSNKIIIDFNLRSMKDSMTLLMGYAGNLGLSFGISAVTTRLDVQLIYVLLGATSAGVYSSAQKLISIIPQFLGGIDGVFSPLFAQKKLIKKYFYEYLFITLILSSCMLITTFYAKDIISLIFGQKYVAAIPVLQLLLIGMAVFTLSAPFNSILLYYFGKSFYVLMVSCIQLILTIGLLFILVPKYQVVGAGWVFLITQTLILLLVVVLTNFARRKKI